MRGREGGPGKKKTRKRKRTNKTGDVPRKDKRNARAHTHYGARKKAEGQSEKGCTIYRTDSARKEETAGERDGATVAGKVGSGRSSSRTLLLPVAARTAVAAAAAAAAAFSTRWHVGHPVRSYIFANKEIYS